MKVPLSWLKEFVDINIPIETLAQRLTLAGMEVADIIYIGLDEAELPWNPEQILVANILEVKPHPNADRLVLADVDYGGSLPHTVVTGAPNLFPFKGQGRLNHPLKSVFAREGARLYDGHAEGKVITTLKGRPVRGVMSDAMLCSEKELGISDEHEGIMFLEDDAPVGMPLRDYMGDVVLDLDLTPNYARCLSIVGVAREIAALTGAALRLPAPQVLMEGPPIADRATVTVKEPQLCPRFTAGLIEGITIGPSPQWMQRRLRYAGMRPVNNIVDISNYVMLEWGEPSHAFDADRVRDQHLIVRLAQPGERLTTLDGKNRDLTPGEESGLSHPPLLVCDPAGPSGVAGVMGGEDSEVRDTTTRVLLEAAIWEPGQIRRTARELKLPSEASRRFERGVDYEAPLIAQRRALELMRTIAGGKIAQGFIDVYPQPWQTLVLDLPSREIERIIGIQLSAYEIADLLRSLGFGVAVRDSINEAVVQVTVPSFRQDVTLLADLCEEVARIYGYDRVPSTNMPDELPAADSHPDFEIEQTVRDVMVGSGLDEIITHTLTSMKAVALIQPSEAVAERYLRVSNPISPEYVYLQRSLLPTVLESFAANLRDRDRALLFEIGRVYVPSEAIVAWQTAQAYGNTTHLNAPLPPEQALPDEPRRLTLAMAGPRSNLGWNTPAPELMDFFDIKGVIEILLARLNVIDQVAFTPLTDDERFHPGRAARLELRGTQEAIGVLGELHPLVRERLELSVSRALAAELDLDALIRLTQQTHYVSISRYPATVQDIAVVAALDIPADRVAAVIRQGAGNLLESLTLFDVYTGAQIGEEKRSLAYRLTFRAPDRTLSDDALVKVRAKIIKLLEREIGASIRG
jgi:phenylalanyl-tRNA synthetase beta chain